MTINAPNMAYPTDSNVFRNLTNDVKMKGATMEIFYIDPLTLHRIAPDESTIQKWYSQYNKFDVLEKWSTVKKLLKINLVKIDKIEPLDVRILVIFSNTKASIHQISIGQGLTIDGNSYKYDERVWILFEDIIAPGARVKRQNFLNNIKMKK